MPIGLPSAQALLEDKSVGFFSIDTDVLHNHGYKFSAGALSAQRLSSALSQGINMSKRYKITRQG